MESRKKLRKQHRLEKKHKRCLSYHRAKGHAQVEVNNNISADMQSEQHGEKKNKRKRKLEHEDEKRLKLEHQRELINQEEKMIRKCERMLRLKSYTKRNKIPKSFYNDGLGELIELCNNRDSDQYKHQYERENGVENIDHNPEEEDEDDGQDEDDDQDDAGHEETSSVEEKPRKARNVALVRSDGCYEDIYGFVHTPQGEVIKTNNNTTQQTQANDSQIDERLQRRLRGQLNRMTSSNIAGVSNEIVAMYRDHSRYAINQIIWSFVDTIILKVEGMLPPKLVSELAMLIAILYAQFGQEVGAFFVHSVLVQFHKACLNGQNNESKRLRNVISLMVNMHATGLLDSRLLYEVVDKLCHTMDTNTLQCLELVDMVLKSSGFLLRKDDPARMKTLIINIHNLVAAIDASRVAEEARCKYVLESLTAIKNNNVAKLKTTNPVVMGELIETTLKAILNKTRVECIPGQYDAVIQSSHWFSFTKHIVPHELALQESSKAKASTIDTRVMQRLCDRLRINTPLRRQMLEVLVQCTDYIDAACKLIDTGKKRFSEVVNLVVHVAVNEKHYNAFYVHLLHHLATCDRKFKVALDFAIRDKLSTLEDMQPLSRAVLATMMFSLMKSNTLSITCLKVIEFTDMNETCVAFIRNILELVLQQDNTTMECILSKIGKKDDFSKAMTLFINCFMEKHSKHSFARIQQLRRSNAY